MIKNKLKNKLKIIGLAALVSASVGCEQWPQFTGSWLREDVSRSDPNFKGDKNWPEELRVVHGLEYKGPRFNHHLGFELKPKDSSEAEGNIQFMLSRLTNISEGVYPNETPDGQNIYNEKLIYGGPAFCDSQVKYWIFAEIPNHELLDEVYPSHVGNAGFDPVMGTPYDINPNPEELEEQYNEEKADEWFEFAEDGLEITMTIIRDLDSTTSGCYDKEGEAHGYLPKDKWGNAWSKATYISDELDYSTNILTKGLEDLEEFNDSPVSLVRQINPDVGSTNQ